MAKKYVNEQRAIRSGEITPGSKNYGSQGGQGSGEEKCSANSAPKSAAKFQEASAVIGQEIAGEMNVPGVSIVKGVSAPSFAGEKKGEANGKSLGSSAKVPTAGKESGYR